MAFAYKIHNQQGVYFLTVVPDVPLQRASGTTNKADLQSAASRRAGNTYKVIHLLTIN